MSIHSRGLRVCAPVRPSTFILTPLLCWRWHPAGASFPRHRDDDFTIARTRKNQRVLACCRQNDRRRIAHAANAAREMGFQIQSFRTISGMRR